MSYYRVCPLCGATLDPGERCDCREAQPLAVVPEKQICGFNIAAMLRIKKEAAPVLQHQNGKVEKVLTAKFPPPILHENTKNARRFA